MRHIVLGFVVLVAALLPGQAIGDSQDDGVVDDETVVAPAGSGSASAPGAVVLPGDSSAAPASTTTAPAPVEDPPPPATADLAKPVAEPPPASPQKLTLASLLSENVVLSGYTQVDYGSYDRSLDELSAGSRAPLNEDSWEVRRAHLRLENEWKYVGYVAEADFGSNGSTARPVAFDVHAHLPGAHGDPPLLTFKAGLFPVPFTYQNESQRAFEIFFVERALFVDGFIPGRFDLGAAISGHIWSVDWILAAQNGQPTGTEFAYQDPNNAKDYSGRVEVGGELVGGVHAAVGVSFLKGTGFSAGTAPTKDSFDWLDLNEDGRVTVAELVPIPGAPGRASENFDRWGLAGDVRIWGEIPRLGQLRIDAEIALGKNLDRFVAPADPVFLGRDQRGLGFYASVTQYVTKYAEVGFRYDQYEPNIDDLELFEGGSVLTRRKFKTYTAGVSGRLGLSSYANARVHLEYAYQQNSLGRDASGKPAQLDNGAMRVRFEVVF